MPHTYFTRYSSAAILRRRRIRLRLAIKEPLIRFFCGPAGQQLTNFLQQEQHLTAPLGMVINIRVSTEGSLGTCLTTFEAPFFGILVLLGHTVDCRKIELGCSLLKETYFFIHPRFRYADKGVYLPGRLYFRCRIA